MRADWGQAQGQRLGHEGLTSGLRGQGSPEFSGRAEQWESIVLWVSVCEVTLNLHHWPATLLSLRTWSGPSGSFNPRLLRTWKGKHNQRRKQPLNQQEWPGTWTGPSDVHSAQARLPGGRISLSLSLFLKWLHGSAPWGAFCTHCEAQLSRGLLHMSCSSAGSCLGNFVFDSWC